MSFFTDFLGGGAIAPAAAGDPVSGTSNPEGWLLDIFGGLVTASGFRVSVRDARAVPGIQACIRVLSDDLAKVPFLMYRRKAGGGKELAENHPCFRLVKTGPAPWLHSSRWRRVMFDTALAHGNAHSRVFRNGIGFPIRLTPCKAGAVQVKWTDDGEPFFDITNTRSTAQNLSYQDVMHLAYQASTDDGMNGGVMGVSPIHLHKETIALCIAAERFAASFFRNGARPSIVVESPNRINDEGVFRRLREQLEATYGGLENHHKIAILELGMKLNSVSFSNHDSQLIEIRKEQAIQCCTIYGVPPHKIGILDRATNNNIEHQGIDYVTGPVSSLAKAFEAACATALLTDVEQEEYYFEFNLDALHRGDLLSRYRAYAIGRQWGWLNVDEIRDFENRNPLPDDKGKTYLEPLNMKPANDPGRDPEAEEPKN